MLFLTAFNCVCPVPTPPPRTVKPSASFIPLTTWFALPSLALRLCTITCVFFGFACYPNHCATAPHKLTPRSALCVFLGYSTHHKGYQCLDRSSNQVIISRHVTFDESTFPFAAHSTSPVATDFDFLDDATNPVLSPIGPSQHLPAGPSSLQMLLAAPPAAAAPSTLAEHTPHTALSAPSPAVFAPHALPASRHLVWPSPPRRLRHTCAPPGNSAWLPGAPLPPSVQPQCS
jgi:hypothetical protein